jgi:hypothetical protein
LGDREGGAGMSYQIEQLQACQCKALDIARDLRRAISAVQNGNLLRCECLLSAAAFAAEEVQDLLAGALLARPLDDMKGLG